MNEGRHERAAGRPAFAEGGSGGIVEELAGLRAQLQRPWRSRAAAPARIASAAAMKRVPGTKRSVAAASSAWTARGSTRAARASSSAVKTSGREP